MMKAGSADRMHNASGLPSILTQEKGPRVWGNCPAPDGSMFLFLLARTSSRQVDLGEGFADRVRIPWPNETRDLFAAPEED